MHASRPWLCAAVLTLLLAPAPLHAKKGGGKAHVHGHAKLSVAVEGMQVAIALEAPGDVIFGFEHAPRTDEQKRVVMQAMTKLREEVTTLFALPQDLGCKATLVDVESGQEDALKGSDAKSAAKHDDHHKKPTGKGHEDHHDDHAHADVLADYTLTCAKSPAGATLELGLLQSFARIKRLDAQVLSGSSQRGLTLRNAKGHRGTIKL